MQSTGAKATLSALQVQAAVVTQRLKAPPKTGTKKIGAPKKKTGTQPIKAPSVGTQVKKVMIIAHEARLPTVIEYCLMRALQLFGLSWIAVNSRLYMLCCFAAHVHRHIWGKGKGISPQANWRAAGSSSPSVQVLLLSFESTL